MRLPLLAVLCLLATGAIAGCGSGNDSSASSSTPATAAATTTASQADHQAFLVTVNPICERYNHTIQALQADLQKQGARAQESGTLRAYVAPLAKAERAARRASDDFSALAPPAAEKQQATLVARALRAQAKVNDLLLTAARKNDTQNFTATTEAIKQLSPQVQAVMRAYGMTVCGAPA